MRTSFEPVNTLCRPYRSCAHGRTTLCPIARVDALLHVARIPIASEPVSVHPPLYTASVPVFRHYVGRIEGMVAKTSGQAQLMQAQLQPDMFGFGQQVATALRFSLRVSYPLAGQPVPPDPALGTDAEGLRERMALTRAALDALDPAAFQGAESRTVRHAAGFAELEQDGATFLHLFGMPNFLFHTGMAFAILRANGVQIGKADFDGQHDYPQGFRF
jgi:hypothetical protein